LLSVANDFKDVIFAFDVMNEPHWCQTRAPTGGLFAQRMNVTNVSGFLGACVQRLKNHKIPSTIGHRYFSDIQDTFGSVSVDRPQFHYYAHLYSPSDVLPRVSRGRSAADSVVPIVGEMGSVTRTELDALYAGTKYRRDDIAKLEATVDPWRLGDAEQLPEHI